jgi:hypothetical protein
MSARYINVFYGKKDLYLEGAPVLIRASALLKNTETGAMLAQLKFRNVSGKSISYVKVAITPFDAIKTPLGEAVLFEYLDILAPHEQEFGSKKPLPLPNASTRSFDVRVTHVGFADGSVWHSDDVHWESAKDDSAIMKKIEAEEIYHVALEWLNGRDRADVEIAKKKFESISDRMDVTAEIDKCNKRISYFEAIAEEEKRQREEQERQWEEQERQWEKNKKIIKRVAIVGVIGLLLAVVFWCLYPYLYRLTGNYRAYITRCEVEEFTIPDGVTSIEAYEFQDCKSLTSITIPDGVTSIGDYAFYGCDNLTSITIPDSVTSIGDSAFRGCSSLRSIMIPEGVTSIGSWAFYACDGLTNLTVPDSVTSIGEGAFYGCDNLNNVTIPALAIGYISQKNLQTVVITSGESIGARAFGNCTSLTSVTIPDGVTSVGESAFDGCDNLTNVTLPALAIEYIPRKNLQTVVIASGESIGAFAFQDCTNLTSVTIGNSVTSIGKGAFSNCTSLTSVNIPDSVTSIGSSAFAFCTSLKRMTIPDSVTSIDHAAFYNCTSLESVTIGNSVMSVGDYAFKCCSTLANVTIPDSVTSIGSSAFEFCTSLKSVIIGDGVTSIGFSAFKNCTSLNSVTIGNSVTSISNDTFYWCFGVASVTIFSKTVNFAPSSLFSFDTVIYGYKGSTAQSYAEKYDRTFVALD